MVDPTSGIAPAVLFGQLPRLAGADATIYPTYGGNFPMSQEDCRQIASETSVPWGHLKTIFPTAAGRVNVKQRFTAVYRYVIIRYTMVKNLAVAVWHGIVAGLRRFSGNMSTRRVAAAAVVASLVITPTVLFLVERQHHFDRKKAYHSLLFTSESENAYLRASLQELLIEQAHLTDVLLEAGHRVVSGDQLMPPAHIVPVRGSTAVIGSPSTMR